MPIATPSRARARAGFPLLAPEAAVGTSCYSQRCSCTRFTWRENVMNSRTDRSLLLLLGAAVLFGAIAAFRPTPAEAPVRVNAPRRKQRNRKPLRPAISPEDPAASAPSRASGVVRSAGPESTRSDE